ncbi:hypothetical protein CLV92_10739 [Kineococcus xinjiangensis]|uniref:Uncharacterized protein n=1 Tax=Kineococcus xinjiangensis TaxID=512762 RepID=A0A2S6IJY1_9ACTN|nr:hypothetical protein CLV92_10739 [Kineococcus xinjiangensis]
MDVTVTAQDRQSSTSDEVSLTSVANPRRVRL